MSEKSIYAIQEITDKIFVVALTVKDSVGESATVAKEVRVTNCGF